MLPWSLLTSGVKHRLPGRMTVDPWDLGALGHINVLGHLDGDLVALTVLDLVAVLLIRMGILLTLLLHGIMALLVILGLIGLLSLLGADLVILSYTLLVLNGPGHRMAVGFIGGVTFLVVLSPEKLKYHYVFKPLSRI